MKICIKLNLKIKEKITSPTFNIMKIYLKGTKPLIHIDAYRLADMNTDIGLDEYIGYETGITVIEWPEFIEKLLPRDSIGVTIKNLGENKRERELAKEYANINNLKIVCVPVAKPIFPFGFAFIISAIIFPASLETSS